jgi:capsular polysaccharide biosynthesis protein
VSATDPSPAQAATIANAVQAQLARQAGSTSASAAMSISVVQPALAPRDASAPVLLLDVLWGAGFGLLLGVVVLAGAGAVRAFRRPSSGGLAAPSML